MRSPRPPIFRMVHSMNGPKLAICNFIPDSGHLRRTALDLGFSGVDWTFTVDDFQNGSSDLTGLKAKIRGMEPLEVRFHCAFKEMDLGDDDPGKARAAMELFRRVCRLVSDLEGRFITVHMGLGRSSMEGLSWEPTLAALSDLVSYAESLGVCLCLENLASGWSSRPELFEKLIRKSGAGVTVDIGHARVSPSVESHSFDWEDFISPHSERVFNAHIYHEEREGGHVAPTEVSDLSGRLDLLCSLPCDWWVLELREEAALLRTLRVVREYLASNRRAIVHQEREARVAEELGPHREGMLCNG